MNFLSRFFAFVLIILTLSLSHGSIIWNAYAAPVEKGTGINLQDTDVKIPANLPTLGLEGENNPVGAVEGVLLNYVINPIFFISGGVAVIIIMYSAFRVVSSRGEEEGLDAAKNSLIWAFLGLGLIMLSYTIIRNVSGIILRLF